MVMAVRVYQGCGDWIAVYVLPRLFIPSAMLKEKVSKGQAQSALAGYAATPGESFRLLARVFAGALAAYAGKRVAAGRSSCPRESWPWGLGPGTVWCENSWIPARRIGGDRGFPAVP